MTATATHRDSRHAALAWQGIVPNPRRPVRGTRWSVEPTWGHHGAHGDHRAGVPRLAGGGHCTLSAACPNEGPILYHPVPGRRPALEDTERLLLEGCGFPATLGRSKIGDVSGDFVVGVKADTEWVWVGGRPCCGGAGNAPTTVRGDRGAGLADRGCGGLALG